MLVDLTAHGFDLEHIRPGDLDIIMAPTDVLGVNDHSSCCVRGGESVASPRPNRQPSPWGCEEVEFVSRHLPLTHMDWEVDPDGLREALVRLSRDDDCPLISIAENGAANRDQPARETILSASSSSCRTCATRWRGSTAA